MKYYKIMEKDLTTEQKIKEAARKLFMQKGFGLTRSRDIAEAAGINLALLNYYFRSKERLFEIIMEESFAMLAGSIVDIVYKEDLSLGEMIDAAITRYSEFLYENPTLPLFVFAQMQANPEKIVTKIGFNNDIITNSNLFKLLKKQLADIGFNEIEPVHILINMISMTVFPFVAKPVIQLTFTMNNDSFDKFIKERKTIISKEIKTFLKIQQ